jgi:hypothetical protein
VVEILEFHMSDMMQHRLLFNRPKHVNQLMLHNVIVELKTKCGVLFEHNSEYTKKLSIIDEIGGAKTAEQRTALLAQQRAERELEQKTMREERNKRLRLMAERLKARPKTI